MKFYSYERAQKQAQTRQFDNLFYMNDGREIIIFKLKDVAEEILYRTPMKREAYLESQSVWGNLCRELISQNTANVKEELSRDEEQYLKSTPTSLNEFLKEDSPLTDDEIVEWSEYQFGDK